MLSYYLEAEGDNVVDEEETLLDDIDDPMLDDIVGSRLKMPLSAIY